MKDLEKMLMAKSKKDKSAPMDSAKRKAKMEVIQELIEYCNEEIGSKYGRDMKPMQEVKVMAPDEEGLEEGLDQAQDLMEMMPHEDEEDEE